MLVLLRQHAGSSLNGLNTEGFLPTRSPFGRHWRDLIQVTSACHFEQKEERYIYQWVIEHDAALLILLVDFSAPRMRPPVRRGR